MCTHTITVLVTGFVLALASFLPGPAQAQIDSARPPVQDAGIKTHWESCKPPRVRSQLNMRVRWSFRQISPVKPVRRRLVISSTWAMWSRPGPMVGSASTLRMAARSILSSNARMTLNEFVYDPNGKSNSTLFNLTKGTFTFVAGNIAKTGDMKIDTPVATMGIRGTTPHIEISDHGTVKFSTLIEKGKSKVKKKLGTSAAQQPGSLAAALNPKKSNYLGNIEMKLASQAGEAKVGDLVYQGDVVRTGADGRVSINFTDGTSFNLTNNANMTLNEFVYDPNGKSNSTLFNLSKGTFTFVAGKIAKTGDMKIDTPVATMGIRGTTPHVEISDAGTVKFSTLHRRGKE